MVRAIQLVSNEKQSVLSNTRPTERQTDRQTDTQADRQTVSSFPPLQQTSMRNVHVTEVNRVIVLDRIFEKKDLYEETGTEATTWY
jgi:hypothetical protein